MYKIYINNTPLIIKSSDDVLEPYVIKKKKLVTPYNGKPKSLMNYIDTLEKPNKYKKIVLHCKDTKACFNDFLSLYTIVEAAGGLVFKAETKKTKGKKEVSERKQDLLFIHRRGFYDLPKGKIDEGETIEKAAVREVEEETGISKIKLGDKIMETFHTYREADGTRIMKLTHWFKMYAPKQKLIPQRSEQIDNAFWMCADDFLPVIRKVYGNITDVVKTGTRPLSQSRFSSLEEE